MVKEVNNNAKWYIIIGFLVAVIIVTAVVMALQIKTLNNEINNKDIAFSRSQDQLMKLGTENNENIGKLVQAQGKSTELEGKLTAANIRIDQMTKAALEAQTTISSQSSTIQTMKYPRHFNSVTELTDWLQKDDTNTKYKGLSNAQISFILQIRAARDGYLLPVRLPIGGSLEYITNMAVIGDTVYSVRGVDDFVERWLSISPAMPSYPILPGSEQ